MVSLPRAIGMFDYPDTIGGLQDRIESHKENTGVIYAWRKWSMDLIIK